MREKESITLFPSKSHLHRPKIVPMPAADTTQPPSQQPHYSDSLSKIRTFSAALSSFLRHHDDLQRHLQSILSAVDSKLPLTLTLASPTETLTLAPTTVNSPKKSQISPPPSETLTLAPPDPTTHETEIESICTRSQKPELRKYILTNLSNLTKLRSEIPQALTRSHNAPALILSSIGRFYLQGIRAFDKDSPMVPARKVSVLILEFYLLMDRSGTRVEESTRKEAYVAAVDWRRRLMSEGGLEEADKFDGRGLLLLIGGFGVPKEFSNSEIRDLIFAGCVSEVKDAVRRSSILLERMPVIIEKMMKNKKDSKVVDIIYTFGMESNYPPQPILASFVEESIEAWNKAKKAAHGSLIAQRDADKRHLSDLRSVVGCLKKHKLNPLEILPDCPVTEKIATLEREITDLNKKIEDEVTEKRRLEPKSIKRPDWREDRRDEKRSRFSDHMPPHHLDRDYLDGRISSDRITPIRALNSSFPGHLQPPPYEMHRPLLPDIIGDPYRRQEEAVFRERILRERLVARSYPETDSLLRQASSLEGFTRILSNPSSSRAPQLASDLYQFADDVAERELFGGARSVPSVAPPRYLY